MTESAPKTTPSDMLRSQFERIGWTVQGVPDDVTGQVDRPGALDPSRVHAPLLPRGRGTDRRGRLQRLRSCVHGHRARQHLLRPSAWACWTSLVAAGVGRRRR